MVFPKLKPKMSQKLKAHSRVLLNQTEIPVPTLNISQIVAYNLPCFVVLGHVVFPRDVLHGEAAVDGSWTPAQPPVPGSGVGDGHDGPRDGLLGVAHLRRHWLLVLVEVVHEAVCPLAHLLHGGSFEITSDVDWPLHTHGLHSLASLCHEGFF